MAEIHGVEGMEAEARRFLETLEPAATKATVVALRGDLGAGKTTFVKALAKALGIQEHVTSPTFVIEKKYDLDHPHFDKLIHIDAYRLKGEHHLKVLGFDEDVRSPRNLICIEWPEQAEGAIPQDARVIHLVYSGENTRTISYDR